MKTTKNESWKTLYGMVQSRVFLVRFGIHAVTLQIVGFCQFLKYQCVARARPPHYT